MSRDFYTQHLFNHAYDVVELLAAELTCQVTGAVVGFQRDAVIASQLKWATSGSSWVDTTDSVAGVGNGCLGLDSCQVSTDAKATMHSSEAAAATQRRLIGRGRSFFSAASGSKRPSA